MNPDHAFERERLLPAERFSDETAADETRGREQRGRHSTAIRMVPRPATSGWERRPTSGEFYDAIRADAPTSRQRAIVSTVITESRWRQIVEAWLQGAFTLRQLARAMHRMPCVGGATRHALNQLADVRLKDIGETAAA